MLCRTLQIASALLLLAPTTAVAFLIPRLEVAAVIVATIVIADEGDDELTTDPSNPPAPSAPPVAALTGTGRLRAKGVDVRDAFPVALAVGTGRTVFALADADGNFYSGHLVRKGAKGNRFAVYLDPDSRDRFVSAIAARATSAAGRPATRLLGHSLRLELREEEGDFALKIKATVLTVSLGEVSFKAALSDTGEL